VKIKPEALHPASDPHVAPLCDPLEMLSPTRIEESHLDSFSIEDERRRSEAPFTWADWVIDGQSIQEIREESYEEIKRTENGEEAGRGPGYRGNVPGVQTSEAIGL
jgi:hypothetical protein